MTSPKNSFLAAPAQESFTKSNKINNVFFNVKQFFLKKRQNKNTKDKRLETKASVGTPRRVDSSFVIGTRHNYQRANTSLLELDKKENWRLLKATKKIEQKKMKPVVKRIRGTPGHSVDINQIWTNLRQNNLPKGLNNTRVNRRRQSSACEEQQKPDELFVSNSRTSSHEPPK